MSEKFLKNSCLNLDREMARRNKCTIFWQDLNYCLFVNTLWGAKKGIFRGKIDKKVLKNALQFEVLQFIFR